MAATWRITNQREEDDLTPQGTFVKSMVISFETIPDGVQGSVKVPTREYTEDRVRQLIDDYAARIIRIGQL